ncbi:uncharacterized protein LOC125011120 isoform X2 [Mugil cephalus]|uniref:uncharacterized protein LOC125011120 isoform X2 n=1 Tax=Mugil cephalus TaxID=48193 RepID=UPI001FB8552F|nr:uncharacterized protein LOC125011120 isoform X2 [Mugil cephalus]
MTNEETWRGWNLSLQCAHNKMALKAMEPGSALSFPLIQVPETCDYSTHHNELGLVLVVPYDGCNVMLEAADIVRDDQIDLPKEDGKYGIRSLENSDADADIPLLSNSTDKDNDQYD